MNIFDTQIKKLLIENDKEEPIMRVVKTGFNSHKEWRLKNGELHREDGPAVIYPDGTKEWYINGKHHREDGPAYEGSNGTKSWWINNKLHREDGPATIWSDGSKEWWLNGVYLSEDMWKARVNIKKNVPPEHQQSVIDILDL